MELIYCLICEIYGIVIEVWQKEIKYNKVDCMVRWIRNIQPDR